MTAGLLTFAIALITSLVITLPVRQFAIRVGMVDRPGPRKIHAHPIPLLGGIAIYFAVILALFISRPGQGLSEILAMVAGATLLLLVGTFDDRALSGDADSRLDRVFSGNSCPGFLHTFPRAFQLRRRCGGDGILDHGHHGLLQHSGLYGRLVRRHRRRFVALFCHPGNFEWTGTDQRGGGIRNRRCSWIFAMELQPGQNFHGRRWRDVIGFLRRYAGARIARAYSLSEGRMACAHTYSRSADL